jgi:CRISPR-associated endonuclease/helicase Cas3
MTARNHVDDIASLDAIAKYFDTLIYKIKGDEALDAKKIVEGFDKGFLNKMSFPFRETAQKFKLIEEDTRSLIISRGDETRELLRRLHGGERNRGIFREAGRYSVSVRNWEFNELVNLGAVTKFDEEVFALSDGNYYSGQTGLQYDIIGGQAVFDD